ncbi:MAG TPA: NifB/NifX family molybdenum-iron cluster-binding protein [Rectinemataceae bacterium]|nr:NifB/NifX family molybdenum-iron cluster-binding protein [Rectinemataceae bacterium]
MKYAIPTDDNATVGKVFGRAKSFAIYDSSDSSRGILTNEGEGAEHGAGTGAAAFLAKNGVAVILSPEIGPKAADALKAVGIRIESAQAGIALDAAMAAVGF